MESLLDVLFLFDSVLMDLYPACAEELYSNYCNKLMSYSICFFASVWIFGIAEIGVVHGSPPGTTTEVQRVGFPPAEIRFVSAYLPF
jgi:hypothetical protein